MIEKPMHKSSENRSRKRTFPKSATTVLVFLLQIFAFQFVLGQTAKPPTHADLLRGEYGRYRANNDLLSYALDLRIDPAKKVISGKNTIRFRMLKDDTRIQLDLYDNLDIDKITFGSDALKYNRDSGAVFVDFPQTLKTGQTYSIDFY